MSESGERVGSRFRFAPSQPGGRPVENERESSAGGEHIPVPPSGAPWWPDITHFALTYNAYSRVGDVHTVGQIGNGVRAGGTGTMAPFLKTLTN